MDTGPCDEVTTIDLAAISADHSDNNVDHIPHDDITNQSIDPDHDRSVKDIHRRITPERAARLKRRAAVIFVTTERTDAETGITERSYPRTGPMVSSKSDTRVPVTPVVKRPSLKTRSLPTLPKWMPSSCGYPGSTCAGNAGSGTHVKRELVPEPRSFAQLLSLPVTKRETKPQPLAETHPLPKRLRKWKPTSCTSQGITCGISSNAKNSFIDGESEEAVRTSSATGLQSESNVDPRSEGGAYQGSEVTSSVLPDKSTKTAFKADDGDAIGLEVVRT